MKFAEFVDGYGGRACAVNVRDVIVNYALEFGMIFDE
jgi:hypothetical protein